MTYKRRPDIKYYKWLLRKLADNSTQPYKFAYGRTALKFGLLSLKLGACSTSSPNGMDQATHEFIGKQDVKTLVQKRREIYRIWEKWAVTQGLTSVFSQLQPQMSPMNYAAWTKSHDESRKWFDWGVKNGVDVYSWPTMPWEIVYSKSKAMEYWKQMICFPIHAQMEPEELDARLRKNKNA